MKNVFKKSVPASSVLHNIACDYKLWKIRRTERQTSFFSNYFFRAKCATCSFAFNASNLEARKCDFQHSWHEKVKLMIPTINPLIGRFLCVFQELL